MIRHAILFSALLCATTFMTAQIQSYSLSADKPPQVEVKGSSTLHSWIAKAEDIHDLPTNLQLDIEKGGRIGEFSFHVSTNSLKSGRSNTMDNKIYKALKSSEHPNILFKQTEDVIVKGIEETGSFIIDVLGVLEIAGQSNPISVHVEGRLEEDILTFKGSKSLKMSDFGITPPTAMFGQIVTDDDIEVTFVFTYQLDK